MRGPEAAWLVIVAGGIVTYAIRAVFLVFADRMTALPAGATEALRMIPAAALAALVVPAVLRPEGSVDLVSAESVAAVIAALVALGTRNVVATIAIGLGAVILLGWIPGW